MLLFLEGDPRGRVIDLDRVDGARIRARVRYATAPGRRERQLDPPPSRALDLCVRDWLPPRPRRTEHERRHERRRPNRDGTRRVRRVRFATCCRFTRLLTD